MNGQICNPVHPGKVEEEYQTLCGANLQLSFQSAAMAMASAPAVTV